MNGWPHSPTLDELQKGIFAIPRLSADPYLTVGVWSDGAMGYYIAGSSIWLCIYDRSLDTTPQTGIGWRKAEFT